MHEFENVNLVENYRTEILQRLDDAALVPYERDRQLIQNILERILNISDWEKKKICLVALSNLIPRYKQGEHGREKWIADIKINKGHELLMRSRTSAEEVDPAKALLTLPEEVQKHIFSEAMALELTDRCTVACNFCAVAEKGPIKKKMSFDSLVKIFRTYVKYRKETRVQKPNNHFYYNTDPFDWRVVRVENGEVIEDLDLRDVYQAWLKASPKHNREHLRLSTGIPVGEELRVLGFMDMLINTPNVDHSIRFSLRNEMLRRASFIDLILRNINNDELVNSKIESSSLKSYTAAHNAAQWRQVREIGDFSHHDIEFMACVDSIPIGPDGGRSAVMGGGSDELPESEYFQDLIIDEDETSITYQIIHGNKNTFDYKSRSGDFMRRVPTTRWNFPQEDFFDESDAHRSLLRISDALAIRHLFLRGESTPLSHDDRLFLGKLPEIDIQNLREYTKENPGRNRVMEIVLKYIDENAVY